MPFRFAIAKSSSFKSFEFTITDENLPASSALLAVTVTVTELHSSTKKICSQRSHAV